MEAQAGAGDARKRIVLTVVAAVVALAAIVAVALLSGGGDSGPTGFSKGSVPPRKEGDLNRASEAAGCALVDSRSEGRTQTGEAVDYRADPPHSGPHSPEPAPDAAYRSDPPPTEKVVHSLFHGRIAIWFDPSLHESDIGDLKALYDESPQHVLLLPRESMEPRVAATTWTHSLTCPELNARVFDAIRAFRDTWRDTAPEFVP
jgi:hypothetical protein